MCGVHGMLHMLCVVHVSCMCVYVCKVCVCDVLYVWFKCGVCMVCMYGVWCGLGVCSNSRVCHV